MRYPHTAVIEQTTEIETATGFPEVVTESFEVQGRYEPAGQSKDLDQSAKFYCQIDPRFDNGNITGQRLFFNGSWIGISQAYNYQFHAELWLD